MNVLGQVLITPFQLAELHHHLTKTSTGIESGVALNLSQNNQDGSTASHHNHLHHQQQQQQLQQQQWMAQDYFGGGTGGSGSQFPFAAHWMSMGLDQPSGMASSSYSFSQGLQSELEQQPSRSYTPGKTCIGDFFTIRLRFFILNLCIF